MPVRPRPTTSLVYRYLLPRRVVEALTARRQRRRGELAEPSVVPAPSAGGMAISGFAEDDRGTAPGPGGSRRSGDARQPARGQQPARAGRSSQPPARTGGSSQPPARTGGGSQPPASTGGEPSRARGEALRPAPGEDAGPPPTGYAAPDQDERPPDREEESEEIEEIDETEEVEEAARASETTPEEPGRLIAVTGAGDPAGIAVIRALQSAGERVLALDADPGAAGLHLASLGAALPRADSAGYGDALVRAVEEYRPVALVCTIAEEYQPLRLIALRLAELGCRTWLPPSTATETCLDKGAFAATMLLHGIPHPPTALSPEAALVLPGPWVVKPAQGWGSRSVIFADTEAELARALAAVATPLAQTRVSGREFTADVLLDRDGTLLTCVPRWRDVTRGGTSVRGATFDSTAVTRTVAAALTAVGLTGPANVRGFVTDPQALTTDPEAVVRVTVVEINPRFSGGLPLTLAAGADVVGTYLAGTLDPTATLPRLTFRPGVHMARYFAEVYYTGDGTRVADPLVGPDGHHDRTVIQQATQSTQQS